MNIKRSCFNIGLAIGRIDGILDKFRSCRAFSENDLEQIKEILINSKDLLVEENIEFYISGEEEKLNFETRRGF